GASCPTTARSAGASRRARSSSRTGGSSAARRDDPLPRLLRRRRAALRDDLSLPLPRAAPGDLLLAPQGAALLHGARGAGLRGADPGGVRRALLRPPRPPAPLRGRGLRLDALLGRGRRSHPRAAARRALHRAGAQPLRHAALLPPAAALPARGGRGGPRGRVVAPGRARARRADPAPLLGPAPAPVRGGREPRNRARAPAEAGRP